MHVCSPHTRLSALLGCLEWKHSQGWQRKSGKHLFLCKQKNTSLACCYCTILGHCFVCSNNSRTFKWKTEPETRAHPWRWGEKAYRPPRVCVCMWLSVFMRLFCVCVFSLACTPSLCDCESVCMSAGLCTWRGMCAYRSHGFLSFLFLMCQVKQNCTVT